MADELGVPARAALLALMTFAEETVANPDINARYGFDIEKEARETLEAGGFIMAERDSGRPGRPFVHTLLDKGWHRCEEELGAPVPVGAHKAYRVLYGVLGLIGRHLAMSHRRLSDFVSAVDPESRIRTAYRELVDSPSGWVSLRRLRDHLDDLSRRDIDAALRRLVQNRGVSLAPESNQKILTELDRAAAIRIGDEDKHLLSIE